MWHVKLYAICINYVVLQRWHLGVETYLQGQVSTSNSRSIDLTDVCDFIGNPFFAEQTRQGSETFDHWVTLMEELTGNMIVGVFEHSPYWYSRPT